MKLTYGERWFQHKKRLTKIFDAKAARRRHEKRELYSILVGEESAPICVVEINNDYIGVGFFDEFVRQYLRYTFQEMEPGRAFLSQAIHREFDGTTDNVVRGTVYYFEREGRVTIKKDDYLANERQTKETTSDVTSNWEAYPEFGKYEAFLRKDR
jgi:hypothetical protein